MKRLRASIAWMAIAFASYGVVAARDASEMALGTAVLALCVIEMGWS